MSLALNGGSALFETNATGTTVLGAIRAPLPANQAKIFATADAALGTGEILVLSLRYLQEDGTVVNVGTFTLNDANVLAAGTLESAFIDVTGLEVGNIVALRHVYTAGGGPADPSIAVSVQFS